MRLPLIAKIEKPEAVSRLGEVTEAFDGIMVARGDPRPVTAAAPCTTVM